MTTETVRDRAAERGLVTDRTPIRWLLAFAVAYGVLHHQGAFFAPLGNLGGVAGGGTRLADWLDLLTPIAILGPAVAVVVTTRPHRGPAWAAMALGALLYTEGHGIHLASNSISNETESAGGHPSPVTHLWDEPVGHHLWFAGVALVMVALVLALHRRHRIDRGPVGVVSALGVGVTWATNALEGGTVAFSALTAIGFVAWALQARSREPDHRSVPDLVLLTFVAALVLLAGYGVWQGGFPQPSQIDGGLLGGAAGPVR